MYVAVYNGKVYTLTAVIRDLCASEYNLDILLEYANQQLAMLSQRYTLKRLDNSLSLAIIDHDMDGETQYHFTALALQLI